METNATDAGRLNYSVPELAKRLDLGTESVYDAIKRNEIPHLRIGRRIILPKSAIEKWLESAGGQI